MDILQQMGWRWLLLCAGAWCGSIFIGYYLLSWLADRTERRRRAKRDAAAKALVLVAGVGGFMDGRKKWEEKN